MNNEILNIFDGISARRLRKKFMVTWILLLAGLVSYFIFVLIAFQVTPKTFPYYLLQNMGIFLLFTFLLLAYSAIASLVSGGDSDTSILSVIKASLRKAPYIFATAAALIIAFAVIVVIQGLVAYLGILSKVGPALLALITVPFFIINLVCLVVIICIILTVPPYVSGNIDKKSFLPGLASIVRERWLEIFIFAVVSLGLLVLGFFVLYYIVSHATGITRSLQWNIGSFYPNLLGPASMKSFFSDIAMKIAPGSESVGMTSMYDFGPFTYGQMLTFIISASYVLLYSCIIVLPLSLYFWGSSVFFGRMFKK